MREKRKMSVKKRSLSSIGRKLLLLSFRMPENIYFENDHEILLYY